MSLCLHIRRYIYIVYCIYVLRIFLMWYCIHIDFVHVYWSLYIISTVLKLFVMLSPLLALQYINKSEIHHHDVYSLFLPKYEGIMCHSFILRANWFLNNSHVLLEAFRFKRDVNSHEHTKGGLPKPRIPYPTDERSPLIEWFHWSRFTRILSSLGKMVVPLEWRAPSCLTPRSPLKEI